MKKSAFFFVFFVLFATVVFAQTEKKNVVKVFPTSFVFGKGTLGYERVINKNGSITLNLGLPTGTSPFNYVSMSTRQEINILDGHLDGLLLMPGYRFNLSKKNAPLGFYIEPYLKYEKFNFEIETEFIDDENEHFRSGLNGDYIGRGIGIQFGFQFFIGDVVSMEWSFIGFEGKSAGTNFKYTDYTNTVNMNDVYTELKADFSSDLPIIGDKIEYEIGSNFVNGKASGLFLPGLRSAFSLGIAF